MQTVLTTRSPLQMTLSAVENFVLATNAQQYHYRLKHFLTGDIKTGIYKPDVLTRQDTIRFLRDANSKGFNIYCRPVGYEYLLLDDLIVDVLPELAQLMPCLLIETSPNNFQAWLHLKDVPADRDEAKAVCQELAIRFGADLGSAEPDHVGRLPGFTNRKEKHRQPNGYFPFVLCRKWADRLSPFHPQGGGCVPTNYPTANYSAQRSPANNSVSEQDFGVACGLLKIGKSEQQVYDHLLTTSPDLQRRRGRNVDAYLRRTVANARKAVGLLSK